VVFSSFSPLLSFCRYVKQVRYYGYGLYGVSTAPFKRYRSRLWSALNDIFSSKRRCPLPCIFSACGLHARVFSSFPACPQGLCHSIGKDLQQNSLDSVNCGTYAFHPPKVLSKLVEKQSLAPTPRMTVPLSTKRYGLKK
jgi:hypothetical protein